MPTRCWKDLRVRLCIESCITLLLASDETNPKLGGAMKLFICHIKALEKVKFMGSSMTFSSWADMWLGDGSDANGNAK